MAEESKPTLVVGWSVIPGRRFARVTQPVVLTLLLGALVSTAPPASAIAGLMQALCGTFCRDLARVPQGPPALRTHVPRTTAVIGVRG